MPAVQETVDAVAQLDVDKYKYGFSTDIESDKAPKGLNEEVIAFISAKKEEPEWMLAWRLEAFRRWQQMTEPKWARVDYPEIDFQDIYYYAAPKIKERPKSLDEMFACARNEANVCSGLISAKGAKITRLISTVAGVRGSMVTLGRPASCAKSFFFWPRGCGWMTRSTLSWSARCASHRSRPAKSKP